MAKAVAGAVKVSGNMLDLLRKAIEIAMPNLRHYLRPVRKAKVVNVYPAKDGKYYADVQILRNDETIDPNEPIIPKVEIPVIWGGPKRGVVCPPAAGAHCDLSYYDGDPNYPRISNFRWYGFDAPDAELGEFVIQLEPGVEIRIDSKKQVVTLTPENINAKAGKNWTVNVGNNATIVAGKEISLEAGTVANIAAPMINLRGRMSCTAFDGTGKGYAEFEGDVVIKGNEVVAGDTTIGGDAKVGASVTANTFIGSVQGCSGCGG